MDISRHYDLLIENGNDPVLDGQELKAYMDKWDGQYFLNQLDLSKAISVLEIGCGTGRILSKMKGIYASYTGVDLSEKTIKVASRRFSGFQNVEFICADFLDYEIATKFDLVLSTLTFMHVKNKKEALEKIFSFLRNGGRFVLSIDKNQDEYIDTGYSRIKIFPDQPENISRLLTEVGFVDIVQKEIEHAFIFTANKI